jgi:hypothetical protein
MKSQEKVENSAANAEMLPKIRPLMPEGFISKLADETGMSDPAAISNMVRMQQYRKAGWPAVLALAEKHNPAGFAAWVVANPDKVPANVAA